MARGYLTKMMTAFLVQRLVRRAAQRKAAKGAGAVAVDQRLPSTTPGLQPQRRGLGSWLTGKAGWFVLFIVAFVIWKCSQ